MKAKAVVDTLLLRDMAPVSLATWCLDFCFVMSKLSYFFIISFFYLASKIYLCVFRLWCVYLRRWLGEKVEDMDNTPIRSQGRVVAPKIQIQIKQA